MKKKVKKKTTKKTIAPANVSPAEARKRILALEKEIASLSAARDPAIVVPEEVMSGLKKKISELMSFKKSKAQFNMRVDIDIKSRLDDFYYGDSLDRYVTVKASFPDGDCPLDNDNLRFLSGQIAEVFDQAAPLNNVEQAISDNAETLRKDIKVIAETFDIDADALELSIMN